MEAKSLSGSVEMESGVLSGGLPLVNCEITPQAASDFADKKLWCLRLQVTY